MLYDQKPKCLEISESAKLCRSVYFRLHVECDFSDSQEVESFLRWTFTISINRMIDSTVRYDWKDANPMLLSNNFA
jgi:hypothetical protein